VGWGGVSLKKIFTVLAPSLIHCISVAYLLVVGCWSWPQRIYPMKMKPIRLSQNTQSAQNTKSHLSRPLSVLGWFWMHFWTVCILRFLHFWDEVNSIHDQQNKNTIILFVCFVLFCFVILKWCLSSDWLVWNLLWELRYGPPLQDNTQISMQSCQDTLATWALKRVL